MRNLPLHLIALASAALACGACGAETGAETPGTGSSSNDVGTTQEKLGGGTTLQITGVSTETPVRLLHSSRASSGSWDIFRNVELEAGDIGTPVATALRTNAAGQTHVLAVNSAGNLFHTIRSAGGSWSPFGNVESVAGTIGDVSDVAIAEVGSDMHILAVDTAGHLWHTIRFANGAWQPFGDVEAAASEIGNVIRVSATGNNLSLHVCVIDDQQRIRLATRGSTGTWVPFSQETPNGIKNVDVSCSIASNTLHMLRIRDLGSPTFTTKLEHRTLGASNIWSAWGDVNAVTGSSANFREVSSSEVTPGGSPNNAPGELHVVARDGGAIYHAVRTTNGGWTSFTNVAVPIGFLHVDSD